MSGELFKNRISQLEQSLEQSQSQEKILSELLEKKLNEIYIHYHISRTIGSLHDLQDMLSKVTAIIKKCLPFERISVYILNENNKYLELAFSSGLDIQQRITVPLGNGTPGRIAENGEHVHIHDLSIFYETFKDFIHYPGEKIRDGSYIGIALKANNATIGVLGMDNPTKHSLGVDDMDFMTILSHQLAAGIEKALLFSKIQHLSQHDELTGLYNYRIFQERLLQEIKRSSRTHKPLSLLMLDIDNFKQVNDTYGHQVGDEVLKELSNIIVNQSRCSAIDVCCRYGGEEFAIIMPELELHNAINVADRIRAAVENHAFTLKGQRVQGAITVSFGVATLTENDNLGIEELIKKADEALYLSKKDGRNRVSYIPTGR